MARAVRAAVHGARLLQRPCQADQARVELAHVLPDARRVVALGVDADEDRAHLVPVLLLCARAAV